MCSFNFFFVDSSFNLSNVSLSLVKDGQYYKSEVVDVNFQWDIALVRCKLDVEPFEIDLDPVIGSDIIAIGSPHGYENNVSTGSIGSVDRQVYNYKGAPNYIFVDLSIFPGNSGGPVVKESNGKVVGMVTLIVSRGSGYGLNAALPSSYIIQFLNENIGG